MPTFTNQATLSYNDRTTNSNIVSGEVIGILTATKTAVDDSYAAPGDTVTYVVSVVNSSNAPVSGLTVSDDLGGYPFGEGTLYPLGFEAGSVVYLQNGQPQPAPTVTAGPPLQFSGITLPAGGNITLIYEATVTGYAPLQAGDTVVNTVTVTGAGLSAPVTASETVDALQEANLTITKAVSPVPVAENGRLTYTFLLRNNGNTAAVATDNLTVTDTFDPVLSDLTVTYNGAALTPGTDYTYDQTTGAFATRPGLLTVPAASYVQNPATGEWGITPGTGTLVVSGTV